MADGVARFDPFAGRGKRSIQEASDDLRAQGTPIPQGGIEWDGVSLTPKGLKITRTLSEFEWWVLFKLLLELESSASWLIGDALLYSEREYGKTYQQIAEHTGREVATLYDCVYVAKQVKFSVRTEKLSFTHHKRIAAREQPLQQMWLAFAQFYQLTDAQFRGFLKAVPESGQIEWLDRVAQQKPRKPELLAIIAPAPAPKGVARVAANASKLHEQAERQIGRKENRAALGALADDEIAYWTNIKRTLEQG